MIRVKESKENNKQGINKHKANKRGNKTYQQNKIRRSNLSLGNEALTQI